MQTCVRAAIRRGGQKGAAPSKAKLSLPQTAQHTHPNFRYPCSSFKMVAFFFWNQPRPRRKVDHIGAMTFFFWISTENLMKTRPTQKFWPLQKQILPPLELRSSCGIDMCVKKIGPHQPEASPHVTGVFT